jgi:hypothetical protein
MRAVVLERHTRSMVTAWSVFAGSCSLAAGLLATIAGGKTAWLRLVLALASAGATVAATRFRIPLHLGVWLGVIALAFVPFDARLDRSTVAAIGSVLVLIASESAHVARRLVTAAPVRSSAGDRRALVSLALWAVAAVAVTAAVAHFARLGSRWWVAGVVGVIALTVGTFDRARRAV